MNSYLGFLREVVFSLSENALNISLEEKRMIDSSSVESFFSFAEER